MFSMSCQKNNLVKRPASMCMKEKFHQNPCEFFWGGGQVRQNRYCFLWVNMHGCSCKLSTCTGTLCSKQLPNSQATSPKLFDAENWAVKLKLPTTSEDITSTHKLEVVFRWRFFLEKLFFLFFPALPSHGETSGWCRWCLAMSRVWGPKGKRLLM